MNKKENTCITVAIAIPQDSRVHEKEFQESFEEGNKKNVGIQRVWV